MQLNIGLTGSNFIMPYYVENFLTLLCLNASLHWCFENWREKNVFKLKPLRQKKAKLNYMSNISPSMYRSSFKSVQDITNDCC